MPDLRLRLLLVLDQGVALYEARAAIEGDVQLLDLAKLGEPVIHILLVDLLVETRDKDDPALDRLGGSRAVPAFDRLEVACSTRVPVFT